MGTPLTWRAGAGAVALATLATLLTGCGSEATTSKYADYVDYVALGDSYTAAPGVSPALGTGDCGRSRSNYPRLVAAQLKAPLTDVSCSGATVRDLLKGQAVTGQVLPAQIASVTQRTDLVTIGVGGNDLDLIGLATTCARGGAECGTSLARVSEVLRDLPARLSDLVRQVKRRAPKATVVLVGYPTIISAQAPCSALPVAREVIDPARDVNARLAEAIKAAAATTKTTFIDLYRATADHGLCGAAPWIAGLDGKGAQPFHPTEDEQKAVAAKILDAVG